MSRSAVLAVLLALALEGSGAGAADVVSALATAFEACALTSIRMVAPNAANTLNTTTNHRVLLREVAIERHPSHVREGQDRSPGDR